MRYDGAPTRRERILAVLLQRGFISVSELAGQLGVSGMTVRRDLRRLEHSGRVHVVHGGARLADGARRTTFAGRLEANSEAKRRVAREAVRLVDDRATVALDAGTTTYEVAVALPKEFSGLVVTHSVPVIQLLLDMPRGSVIGLGGELLTASNAFIGQMTVDAAHQLRIGTFFLGAAAVDQRGAYVEADAERPTKLALMEVADRVVLLADHTKFTVSAPVLLCPLTRLHMLITDRPPPPVVAHSLERAGCRLTVAEQAGGTPIEETAAPVPRARGAP
jgi:DeoR family fructose operon transcriptional repressor